MIDRAPQWTFAEPLVPYARGLDEILMAKVGIDRFIQGQAMHGRTGNDYKEIRTMIALSMFAGWVLGDRSALADSMVADAAKISAERLEQCGIAFAAELLARERE